ncbi:MAG TPA: glycerate kinase, partial [Methylophaga sp.]|nr:glycerate kinase [Methylophaga sp.]
DEVFSKVKNFIIGNNYQALQGAYQQAKMLGYRTLILSSSIQGEAREVARVLAAIAREVVHSGNPLSPPACIIAGGETTVTIRGEGLGGRNQELALAIALDLQGLDNVAFLSAGSDGTDGPTDAAGAFAFGDTVARGQNKGLDAQAYLQNNDSYHYFKAIGDLFQSGPTGTNVMDLQIILVQ